MVGFCAFNKYFQPKKPKQTQTQPTKINQDTEAELQLTTSEILRFSAQDYGDTLERRLLYYVMDVTLGMSD